MLQSGHPRSEAGIHPPACTDAFLRVFPTGKHNAFLFSASLPVPMFPSPVLSSAVLVFAAPVPVPVALVLVNPAPPVLAPVALVFVNPAPPIPVPVALVFVNPASPVLVPSVLAFAAPIPAADQPLFPAVPPLSPPLFPFLPANPLHFRYSSEMCLFLLPS